MNNNKSKAFTTIELILVIAIVAVVSVIGVTVGLGVYNRQDLTSNRDLLVTSFYNAQGFARASVNNSDWGVYIDNNNNRLYIYSGSSFASRDTSQDIIFNLSGNMSFSGDNEVRFQRISGLPVGGDSFTISAGGESLTTTIGGFGTINT